MSEKKKDELLNDHNHDGVDRRGFLKCMAWAGTGAFCVMKGGVLNSYSLSRVSEISTADMMGELSFVQISDSHMGFNKPANPDVAGTLKAASTWGSTSCSKRCRSSASKSFNDFPRSVMLHLSEPSDRQFYSRRPLSSDEQVKKNMNADEFGIRRALPRSG